MKIDTSLTVGESKRTDCPECGGHNTFTITNMEGTLIWNCYKLTCMVSGGQRKGLKTEDILTLLKNAKQAYDKEVFVLPSSVVYSPEGERFLYDNFMEKWQLKSDAIMYDVVEDRVVFPIWGKGGRIVDAIGRSVYNGTQLKWKRYGSSALPYIAGHPYADTCVIVEDAISAEAVRDECNSVAGVALMGTTLTAAVQLKVVNNYTNVIIALDPDARTKALSIRKQISGQAAQARVLLTEDDLKYRKHKDIIKLREMVAEMYHD